MRANSLLILALLLQGPTQKTGVIEGFVLRARTETPVVLVNARVVLEGGVHELVSRTDLNGHFAFAELPSGRYWLRVTKDGFIRQEYPGVAMGATGLPIDLAAGQELRNIVFRMDAAPTISGVILDSGNAPIADVVVQALRRGYDRRGNRTLTSLSSARTDDRGMYRLYWLDPGEYFVSALPPPPPPDMRAQALTIAYFPGFAAIDDAKPVRVELGREATGIDFALTRLSPVTVKGAVISLATGRYAVSTVVLSSPEDGAGVLRMQTKSVANPPPTTRENYSIPAVAPGSYILTAVSGNDQASRRMLVRGQGREVSLGLVVDLELGPGIPVRGRVTGLSDFAGELRTTRVAVEEIDTALPSPPPVPVAPDGSFLVAAVQPGNYSVSVSDLPADAFVRSVSFAGTKVLETPFPVAYGKVGYSDELTVEVSPDGGRITGTVFNQENVPFVGAQVTLVPEGVNEARLDCYRATVTAPDGTFTFRGIVPGDYRLHSWESLEPNAHLNAEFMRSYRDLGTPLRIEPGQARGASLRLIPLER